MSDRKRAVIQQEQVYVVDRTEDRFVIGGEVFERVPWNLLGSCHLYALDEDVLLDLLEEAVSEGWHVYDGSVSDRRGVGGFSVGVGAWGIRGTVQCHRIDAWAIEPDGEKDPIHRAGRLTESMRHLVLRLNQEPIGFRATALSFLRGAYERMGRPLEPNEAFPPALPLDVAHLCRRAHVGGPIVHARTTLAPYVSLDRTRAYGEAMLEELPSGSPIEVELTGDGLTRWTEHALMRSVGVADATVRVTSGPFVPLMPIMKWSAIFERARALYPTGSFRGAFVLPELAAMEQSGRGVVEKLHRVVLFEKCKSLAPVIRYVRRLERDIGITVKCKRMEHMLYGSCSRSLSFNRFASTTPHREPVLQDVCDNRTLERLTTRIEMRRMPISKKGGLPVHIVKGVLSEKVPHGTMDRPDRSAFIVARNRISMTTLIHELDQQLSPGRSGDYVGRIYVDGIDIEADLSQIAVPEGFTVKGTGAKMQVYRSGIYVTTDAEGRENVEHMGLLSEEGTRAQLEQILQSTPDPDGGPFAAGRFWSQVTGYEDPRMAPNQRSEPIDLAPGAFSTMGFEE